MSLLYIAALLLEYFGIHLRDSGILLKEIHFTTQNFILLDMCIRINNLTTDLILLLSKMRKENHINDIKNIPVYSLLSTLSIKL